MFLKVVNVGADCFSIVSSYRVVPIGRVELLSGENRHKVGINWSQPTITQMNYKWYRFRSLSTQLEAMITEKAYKNSPALHCTWHCALCVDR